MNLLDNEQIKMFENEVCEFYKTSATLGIEDWARQKGVNSVRCFLAIQKKNNDKDYVLLQNGMVIFAEKTIESMGVHIDIMALAKE